jgi:hypothetical protein
MIDKVKLSFAWRRRNLKHSEVVLKTLEVRYDIFYQYIFIEQTTELVEKLLRVGFKPMVVQYDVIGMYAPLYYNEEYNISFNLYKPEHKASIAAAIEIADRSLVEKPINVLHAAFRVLLDETKKTPQILMG